MGNSAKNLQENIKFYRINKKLSQEELAERSEISIHFVRDLELGRKGPSLATIDRLADALGVEAFQLIMKPNTDYRKVIKDYANQLKEKINHDIDYLAEKF